MQDGAFLRHHWLFADVPADLLPKIGALFEVESVCAKTPFIQDRVGLTDDKFTWIILRGTAMSSLRSPVGSTQFTENTHGDVLNPHLLLEEERSVASRCPGLFTLRSETTSTCLLARINPVTFLELMSAPKYTDVLDEMRRLMKQESIDRLYLPTSRKSAY
eukprot:2053466-Pyramimonas_sp.AAC.1